ncbi:MAG: sirohydrochlorin chelatase [Mycobacteriaceae bacterium]|nr:sirohydrochlorin chelatase [Mycobacteriaceae bacterium]
MFTDPWNDPRRALDTRRGSFRTSHSAAPALIAVAHGSRDPRSAHTAAAAADRLRQARPDLDVRLAFLDLNAPSVLQVIDAVAAQGHRSAVVVPLLLGSAFHARVDLPGLLATAAARHPQLRLVQADVLGADPRLLDVARERLADMGVDPCDPSVGVAVAAVGSSSAAANADTADVAHRLGRRAAWLVESCFATAAPSLATAAAALRRRGARRIVVAPWFLAPGLLTDRLAADDLPMAAPIGPHPLLAAVILDRYRAATTLLATAA